MAWAIADTQIPKDTVAHSVDLAVLKFGVSAEAITCGCRRKDRRVMEAREWIVARHPHLGSAELAHCMGYSSHSTIIAMRRRIALQLAIVSATHLTLHTSDI